MASPFLSKNMRITAKVTVTRTTVPGGPCDPSYKVDAIVGPAEVQIPARVQGQADRTLLVGDCLTHEELKRLTSVQVYQVQTRAQKV